MRCELLMRATVADNESDTVMLASKSQVCCMITSSLASVNLGKLMFGFSIYTCYVLVIMQEGMDFHLYQLYLPQKRNEANILN